MNTYIMNFMRAVGWAKGHRHSLVVIALILVFGGADLLLNPPEGAGVQWLSAPLLAGGLSVLALVFWPTAKPLPRPPGTTLAHRFLWWATWRGRFIPVFPVVGVGIILADLAFNRYVSAVPELRTHDLVVLLFGAVLIGYRFAPERYERERDFVLLFAAVLSAMLVVPVLILRVVSGDASASVDVYSAYALAPQTSAVLNVLGVPNSIVYVWPETAPGVAFTTAGNLRVTVFITSACSGIYSFAIFASAFTAFVLTEQRKLTRRVMAFFAFGIILAYVANVLRMVVIILIGYRFDTQSTGLQNMLVAHSNAGWIIFLGWIALFWTLLFRFLPRGEPRPETAGLETLPRKRGAFCGICGTVLTPAIPATRCQCGRFYHVECLTTEGRCPICSAPSSAYAPVDNPVA